MPWDLRGSRPGHANQGAHTTSLGGIGIRPVSQAGREAADSEVPDKKSSKTMGNGELERPHVLEDVAYSKSIV